MLMPVCHRHEIAWLVMSYAGVPDAGRAELSNCRSANDHPKTSSSFTITFQLNLHPLSIKPSGRGIAVQSGASS